MAFLNLLLAGSDCPMTPIDAWTNTPSAAAPDGCAYRDEASAAVIISGTPDLRSAHPLVMTTGGAPVAHTSRTLGLASVILANCGPKLVCVVSKDSSSTSFTPAWSRIFFVASWPETA